MKEPTRWRRLLHPTSCTQPPMSTRGGEGHEEEDEEEEEEMGKISVLFFFDFETS